MSDDEGKLVICDNEFADGIRIVWFFESMGDYGAILGEETFTAADLNKAKTDDRDHVLATITASHTDGVELDSRGYCWPSLKKARGALAAIKTVLKNDTGAPWPEWAVKAKAEGWKAPKGWKP